MADRVSIDGHVHESCLSYMHAICDLWDTTGASFRYFYHVPMYTCTYIYSCIHVCMYSHVHMFIYMYTICVYTCMYTYTYTRRSRFWVCWRVSALQDELQKWIPCVMLFYWSCLLMSGVCRKPWLNATPSSIHPTTFCAALLLVVSAHEWCVS